MRRQTKWVFAFLAVVFAASFVFLGVGSGSSALTDFLNGNIHIFGSGGGPSVKSLERNVAKHPNDPKARLKLAQLLVEKNMTDQAITAYKNYLKLKPGNTDALNELATQFETKVNELKNEAQSPPTPPLVNLNAFQPVAQNTLLGTALSSLQPTTLSVTSLQQGETFLLHQQLAKVILQHLAVVREVANKTPGDSSAFLSLANAAATDGATSLELKYYQQFLKKYPNDPLVPDIKRQIKKLEKDLRTGTTSSTG